MTTQLSIPVITTLSLIYFDTGNALYDRCRMEDMPSKAACVATIIGATDMLLGMQFVCPGLDQVNREQLKDIVLKYLENHPEKRDEPASDSIFAALSERFDCKLHFD